MANKRRSEKRGNRGASLVEMTLVFFILIILLMGVVDFARAFYSYITITNASREGASYGRRYPGDLDGILGAVKAEAGAGGLQLKDDEIEILPDPDPDGNGTVDDTEYDNEVAEPGDTFTVTVSYEVPTVLGGILGFDEVPMEATTEMVVFFKPPRE